MERLVQILQTLLKGEIPVPLYPFVCVSCSEIKGEEVAFDHLSSMSAYDGSAPCPDCEVVSTQRIFTIPSIHTAGGLTAAEKTAGTTKNRKETGRYLRDERVKRKRRYGQGTREGDSNELWAGTLPDGMKAPEPRVATQSPI